MHVANGTWNGRRANGTDGKDVGRLISDPSLTVSGHFHFSIARRKPFGLPILQLRMPKYWCVCTRTSLVQRCGPVEVLPNPNRKPGCNRRNPLSRNAMRQKERSVACFLRSGADFPPRARTEPPLSNFPSGRALPSSSLGRLRSQTQPFLLARCSKPRRPSLLSGELLVDPLSQQQQKKKVPRALHSHLPPPCQEHPLAPTALLLLGSPSVRNTHHRNSKATASQVPNGKRRPSGNRLRGSLTSRAGVARSLPEKTKLFVTKRSWSREAKSEERRLLDRLWDLSSTGIVTERTQAGRCRI